MRPMKDCNGKTLEVGKRVKWVCGRMDLSRTHKRGYMDVHCGDKGEIVSIKPHMILVKFDGHTKPVSANLGCIERI